MGILILVLLFGSWSMLGKLPSECTSFPQLGFCVPHRAVVRIRFEGERSMKFFVRGRGSNLRGQDLTTPVPMPGTQEVLKEIKPNGGYPHMI